MPDLDFYKILGYGAIGLGCILALLSYRLLSKEQDLKKPRQNILTSIYAFMMFSLILCAIGFVSEYANNKNTSIIQTQLEAEQIKNLEVANSLSEVLRVKEVAALESNASPEIRRHIELLRNNVSRLRGESN